MERSVPIGSLQVAAAAAGGAGAPRLGKRRAGGRDARQGAEALQAPEWPGHGVASAESGTAPSKVETAAK